MPKQQNRELSKLFVEGAALLLFIFAKLEREHYEIEPNTNKICHCICSVCFNSQDRHTSILPIACEELHYCFTWWRIPSFIIFHLLELYSVLLLNLWVHLYQYVGEWELVLKFCFYYHFLLSQTVSKTTVKVALVSLSSHNLDWACTWSDHQQPSNLTFIDNIEKFDFIFNLLYGSGNFSLQNSGLVPSKVITRWT